MAVCGDSAMAAETRSGGGLGVGSPPPPDVWLYLESDAEVPADPAADYESAADQMLSGSLEFKELLAVPCGDLTVEKSHDVAIDEYRNDSRLVRVSSHQRR